MKTQRGESDNQSIQLCNTGRIWIISPVEELLVFHLILVKDKDVGICKSVTSTFLSKSQICHILELLDSTEDQ